MVSPQFRPPAPNEPRRRRKRGAHSRPGRPLPHRRAAPPRASTRNVVRRRTAVPTPSSSLNRAIVVQTLELSIKLGVNGILGIAAIIGLTKLVPYTLNRHAGLQQLQAEAYTVEGRVQDLQQAFSRYFDPKETEAIARQETIRIAPGQQRVYIQADPVPKTAP